MEAALSVDEAFLSSVVERWRGAMISNRGRPEDSFEVDALASQEFSSVRQPRASEQAAAQPGTFTRPDSYFFPVEDNAGRPTSKLRK
jgi:hypothetical protein